jgi:hypothetical protein
VAPAIKKGVGVPRRLVNKRPSSSRQSASRGLHSSSGVDHEQKAFRRRRLERRVLRRSVGPAGYEIVDAISKEDGKGMTATFFVSSGDEYVRVATSVPKPDGSGRAIGTVLDPAGKAIVQIRQGKPFYGEVTILGTPYITGYEPMTDAAGNVIGIYYVGYKK